uniref:Floricaula/leafy-like transcription factor n=1 Tax=Pinus armandii TaxID=88733 RepID=I6LMV7_PINAR|nr:NEEDLY protein [Pinus armandii]
MDAEHFPVGFFRWDQRPAPVVAAAAPPPTTVFNKDHGRPLEVILPMNGRKELKSLEDLFKEYGVRYLTLAKMTEMGFTANTLVNMTEEEIEDLMKTLVELYHMDLLIGERYGIKSAIRAEKKRLQDSLEMQRLEILSEAERKRMLHDDHNTFATAMASEGTSKELRANDPLIFPESTSADHAPMNIGSCKDSTLILQNSNQAQFCGSGLIGVPEHSSESDERKADTNKQKRRRSKEPGEDGEDRPREHPFIVTEPGELARGKKNGLDYLFDLYEQCGKFLLEVQRIAKEKGEKCPTKVTNQVFRHAKHNGAVYINKPKMRHYVHCYALHCLDSEQSNHLRRIYKERGENVGAWRQACYYPLVAIARENNWDIEGIFNRNEKLKIWYVPTKLRQLCHMERSKECQ